MKIGIVGAGAIGTLFGASLAANHDVRVLISDEKKARAIADRGGLVLDGTPPRHVVATHDPCAVEDVDILLVAVKTYATIEALDPLRDVVPHDATVISPQNGILAQDHIDYALGHREQLALAPTTEAAMLVEPGVARYTAPGETHVGWAPGHGGGDALERFCAALRAVSLSARVEAGIEPFVWDKLLVNAAINPVTALAGVPNGALLERPELRARAAAIAREVAALAAFHGIELPYDDPVTRVEAVAFATAANRSSMLQDLDRGRPTEIDAILGAVVRDAAHAELDVPESQRAYDEVRSLQKP